MLHTAKTRGGETDGEAGVCGRWSQVQEMGTGEVRQQAGNELEGVSESG